MTLTDEQLSILEDAADIAGMEFRRDYSGRGMYGAKCVGVVGNSVQMIKFTFALAREERYGVYELLDEIENPSTDSMAFDKIWYWPGLTAEEE